MDRLVRGTHHTQLAIAILAGVLFLLGTTECSGQTAIEGHVHQELTPTSNAVFDLRSGFWVNLHHFLYLQARLANRDSFPPENLRGAAQLDEAPASLADLAPSEVSTWQEAVTFYSRDLATRDLQLNLDMENINNQLAEMEACPDLEGKTTPSCKSGLRSDLVHNLERAAEVYRRHWWPEQDRANHAWIDEVTPMIQEMSAELSAQLADVYQRAWPPGAIRVDVVSYAGPFGAYTTLDPTHVTLSSRDPRNRGIYGFEVLFHEASHDLASGVNEAIAREFRKRDKPIPRELWHVLLFYTTGEMVRRDLEYGSFSPPGAVRSYLPYAARFGLYSDPWDRFRALLDLYWRPYLDGRVSFDTAIAHIAAAL